MEITEEMLDVIEQVKGRRNPGLWDPRCQAAFDSRKKSTPKTEKTTVKEESPS